MSTFLNKSSGKLDQLPFRFEAMATAVRAVAQASKSFRPLPTRERLLELQKLQCDIFQTSFNPTAARTGAKYLRARLRGPSMIEYYPPTLSISRVNDMIAKERDLFMELDEGREPIFLADEAEEQRLADVASLKARGKGKPKKARKPG